MVRYAAYIVGVAENLYCNLFEHLVGFLPKPHGVLFLQLSLASACFQALLLLIVHCLQFGELRFVLVRSCHGP